MTHVAIPQRAIIHGRKMDGLVLDKTKFDLGTPVSRIDVLMMCCDPYGTSNTTYVTKKTTSDMEYWFELMLRSSTIPAIFAFPMFVLFATHQ
jgi:hypothetical protein